MRREPPLAAIRTAVNEVRPPIMLATLAVILSFLPMLFITGMMGPYMRPMAINVPLAMVDVAGRGVHDHAVARLSRAAQRRVDGTPASR